MKFTKLIKNEKLLCFIGGALAAICGVKAANYDIMIKGCRQ